MSVVTLNLDLPAGQAPTAAKVQVWLAGTTGQPVVGYVGGVQIVGEYSVNLDDNGAGRLELVGNDLIEPSGTVWGVRIKLPHGPNPDVFYIDVPSTGGPYDVEAVLAEAPGSLPSAPLTAEIADRIAADTALGVRIDDEEADRLAGDALLIPLTQKAAANGVATLGSDSKVPSAQLPALAISETFPVASQAAMLALTAQRGDVAIRSDLNKSFILSTDSPSTLADWKELLTPTDTVGSVNGRTGVITGLAEADASNVAAAAAAWRTAIDAQQAGTYLQGLVPTAVKTSAYSAAVNDFVPVDTTSGAVTVTLPSAPADKTVIAVKHVIQGGTNVVTVNCGGTDVFNKTGGATTASLSLLAQALLLQYKASSGIWYVVADDLPLSQLDARFLRLPESATERVIYVGKGANASDSNDGLSPYSAKATLAGAQTALGTNPGAIRMGIGTFIPGVDFVLSSTKQRLAGIGYGTVIDGTGCTGAVVTARASRTSLSDFWVTNVPAGCIGVRVTSTGSTQVVHLDDLFVNNIGTAGVAYGIGDNTILDTSEITLRGCASVGNGVDSWHMALGNGGTGNVLDITNFGGNSSNHAYGVVLNGSTLVSHGLDFETSKIADIWYKQAAGGAIEICGGRSENAAQFLKGTSTGFVHPVKIGTYRVVNLTNTDGKGTTWQSQTPLTLDTITMTGLNVAQVFSFSGGTTALPLNFTAINCTTDADLPFGRLVEDPTVLRTLVGCTSRYSSSNGAPTPLTFGSPERGRRVRRVDSATTLSLDCRTADIFEVLLTSSVTTLALTNPQPGQRVVVRYLEDGVGAWTYGYPANVAWAGGSAPSNTTTARHAQVLDLRWSGRWWEELSRFTDLTPPTLPTFNISDTFARAGTLREAGSLGAELTNGIVWEQLCGVMGAGWTVANAATGATADTTLGYAASVIESGKADATVQADVVYRSVATFVRSLVLRAYDERNFLYVQLTDAQIQVRRILLGVSTSLGGVNKAHVDGTSYTVKAVMTGGAIDVYEGGVLQFTLTLAAADQQRFGLNTKHGIMVQAANLGASGQTYKNFSIA